MRYSIFALAAFLSAPLALAGSSGLHLIGQARGSSASDISQAFPIGAVRKPQALYMRGSGTVFFRLRPSTAAAPS